MNSSKLQLFKLLRREPASLNTRTRSRCRHRFRLGLTVLSLTVLFIFSGPSLAVRPYGTGPAFAQELFGLTEQAAPPGHPLQKIFWPLWERVLQAEKSNPSFTAKGANFGRVDQNTWRNLVRYAAESSETEILHMVNGYFNQWVPKKDSVAWNTPEYWTTPREFMARRGGDCEDYAIAKYYALRFLGIEAKRLRIVIVRQKDPDGRSLRQLHAVLAVYRNNTWFILDNNARPRDNVFPHTQYQGRFQPLYAVNEDGAWVYGNIKREKAPGRQTP